MDWTALTGRGRPSEVDAIRLSIVIHQLGAKESDAGDTTLHGEGLLQVLDHLIRHPTTLAYVLLDHFARRPKTREDRALFAKRVRRLLANERQQHQPSRRRQPWQTQPGAQGRGHLHPFVLPIWRSHDEALALLAGRGLLRVELDRSESNRHPGLSYHLTPAAVLLLDREIYPKNRDSTLFVQLCGVIQELLPARDGDGWQALMSEIDQHLEQFRIDEGLPPEQDLLSALFHHVFQEHL